MTSYVWCLTAFYILVPHLINCSTILLCFAGVIRLFVKFLISLQADQSFGSGYSIFLISFKSKVYCYDAILLFLQQMVLGVMLFPHLVDVVSYVITRNLFFLGVFCILVCCVFSVVWSSTDHIVCF